MTPAPRCGKPMIPYEAVNGPMPEQPECARPAGHNGPCRSAVSLARITVAAITRQAKATRPCECGCGETALWGHRYRKAHNPRNSRGIWEAAA